ncbi:hypothetical protein MKEN_00315700 [Mycena kentingensis (nom. inval.)]|nr:hypothetical protein MKEN_00315700 [Mycena kentingensis (nom. inval.)]
MTNADRFLEIKATIAAENGPDFEAKVTKAWSELLGELDGATKAIAKEGPQARFLGRYSVAASLSARSVSRESPNIKRKGTVVIKDVVDDDVARGWKTALEDFIQKNPQVEGFPADDKQFFMLYWTKSQIEARAHPNMLAATTWLNNLYHTTGSSEETLEGVDLKTPLSYADRFRIRHPGGHWGNHPPHVDGGTIERWEDTKLRACFADILAGSWRQHDAYALEPRLEARTSLYKRPNQSSVFRTFQGWLALSNTAPGQGTLRVFPDVLLSNAYIILRPFFRPLVDIDSADIWDAKNWVFDLANPEIPGVFQHPNQKGFGLHPTHNLHPNLRLNETMTSVPAVSPGDTVFWHCDVVHSVETEHHGNEDSAVMYIPAVPLTPANKAYIARQIDTFRAGIPPPDFPVAVTGKDFVGLATEEDFAEAVDAAKVAMGLAVVAASA